MKHTILYLTLSGLLAAAPAGAHDDSVGWERAELLWNEEYDTYVVAPTLGDDLFQERLVWSRHLAEYVPIAMAYQAELKDYQEGYVWSETHRDLLPRAMVEPCPTLGGLS
jgi:hypothetical protein